jgi:SAM-dependent MidA family methyltransferase
MSRDLVAADGDVIEINEAARAFVADLSIRFRHRPGVALLIDYGPMRGTVGNTLQALADKRPVSPLSPPGSADLTAHVDFADLAAIARDLGAVVQGPRPQGAFLTELGLFPRTERLARGRPAEQTAALIAASRRLAASDAMGELFKVMAICSPGCAPLPGLALPIP